MVAGTGRDALAEEHFDDSLIDTSGTGGDTSGTFNISTATAFVTAGAGVRVAKHGNRSISSKCGSADVIEALGINIQLSPSAFGACLREVGICFLYAPNLHPSMKQVQAVRRESAPADHVQSDGSSDKSGTRHRTSRRCLFRSIWWRSLRRR